MSLSKKAVGSFLATLCLGVTLAGTSHAAGTYKFCAKWQYQFSDQNLGEDYFKYTTTYGLQNAAYTWSIVQRDNQNLWSGYLDSAGCSPEVPANAGTYKQYITAGIQVPNGALVTVTPQEAASSTRWFTSTRILGGLPTGQYTSFSASLGAGDTTAGAISLAIGMVQQNDGRFVSGNTYKVFTELGGFEGYYSEGGVYLGKDEYTNVFVSRQKTVVGHELGHAIQHRLFGLQNRPLTENSTTELCKCDHIDFPAIRSHCLQSRENIGGAQVEGFAHFHAASLFNNPLGTDAQFAYYKEFRWGNGGPDQYPPIVFGVFNPNGYTWHWMQSQACQTFGAGVELDWLTFFYEVTQKTANKFSMTDIANVYKGACGNAKCTGANITSWASLQNSVNTLFGASSAKALYWAAMGDSHGVVW